MSSAAPTPTAKPTVKPTATLKPTQRPVTSDVTLLAVMNGSGKTDVKPSWTKVKDADGYDIFLRNCGKGEYPLIVSVKSSAPRSYKVTGLKKATNYKSCVKAWKKVKGVKTCIGKASPVVLAVTGGYTRKVANPKTVTVKASSVTLTIGQSSTISADVTGVKSGYSVKQGKTLKLVGQIELTPSDVATIYTWTSSDPSVATVSEKGVVKGVKKETVTITVTAAN